MKQVFALILCCFVFIAKPLYAQSTDKPAYAGGVIYSSGGFGGYNPPAKGDSVVVSIGEHNSLSFTIFPKSNIKQPRNINIDFKDLMLMGKLEYRNIVSTDKSVPTGNYDLKLTYNPDARNPSFYSVVLTHFGDGNMATLTVSQEDMERVRIDCILIANLTKLK